MKSLIKIISKILMLSIICLGCNEVCVAADLKIGIINTKDLENCLYAKDIQRKLEKEFNPRKDKFEAKQKELQSKGELLQRDRAILSEKERIAKERELTKLQQETQHMLESLDTEFKSRRQEELIAFNKAVDDIVMRLALNDKYDLILPDQVVMFSKDSLDCTVKIVNDLDAKFKAKK
ncbi:MAG: OmpH family outer membrane protein [Gammaproteobacteria bacterium]